MIHYIEQYTGCVYYVTRDSEEDTCVVIDAPRVLLVFELRNLTFEKSLKTPCRIYSEIIYGKNIKYSSRL